MPSILLLQNPPGETTENVVDEAAQVTRDATRETVTILQAADRFLANARDYLTSAEFVGNVIASVVVVALGILTYRVLTHGVPRVLRWRRSGRQRLDAEAVARIKRQDTAIALIRNVLRYAIFVFVALTILSIFIRNPFASIAGAAIGATILGFGAQSFLRDIIAGFSIVFEGQYNVGDFIHISPPQGVAGIVEELGLRVTKIRSPSGEVHFVPNGSITGVTNYVTGRQRFTVEVQVKDAEAAARVVKSLGESADLYLTPPRLAGREELDGRVRLVVRAGVLPSMSWLVEENLKERIKAAAGEESLAGEPLIYNVDQVSLDRLRSLLPHEEDRGPGP